MNVRLIRTTVMLKLHVPIIMEVSPVLVTKDTVEMEGLVMVSYHSCIGDKPNIKNN